MKRKQTRVHPHAVHVVEQSDAELPQVVVLGGQLRHPGQEERHGHGHQPGGHKRQTADPPAPCVYFTDLVQVLVLPYYAVELVIGSWSSIGPSQASLLDPLDDQLGVQHLGSFV